MAQDADQHSLTDQYARAVSMTSIANGMLTVATTALHAALRNENAARRALALSVVCPVRDCGAAEGEPCVWHHATTGQLLSMWPTHGVRDDAAGVTAVVIASVRS